MTSPLQKYGSIRSMWEGYRDAVEVPRGGEEEQETRRAFYAGVWAVMRAMKAVEGEDDALAWLQALDREGHAFVLDVKEGRR